RRVADNVEIREPCQTEGVAETASSCTLQIEQQLHPAWQLDARVDRPEARQRLFGTWPQAVVSLVRRPESSVSLEDEIHLAGQPPAAILRMRKHCRLCRGRIGRGLCGRTGRAAEEQQYGKTGRARILHVPFGVNDDFCLQARGGRLYHPAARSSAFASAKTVDSPNGGPAIWRPTGNPERV